MNKVKEIRKERGLSQDRLAQLTGISRKYLSMIECQRATPSVSIAMKIASELDVSTDKIFLDLSKSNLISKSYTVHRFILRHRRLSLRLPIRF